MLLVCGYHHAPSPSPTPTLDKKRGARDMMVIFFVLFKLLFFSLTTSLPPTTQDVSHKNIDLDRAMQHLKAFAAQYPPNIIRTPTPNTNFRSMRTSLMGSRPLVRMTSQTEIPDDHVPPLMIFCDLLILHHRLMDEGRTKDMKYVTWLCKAYE